MSTQTPNPQDDTDSPLDGETGPDYAPHRWVDNGTHETLDDGETRYYAVRQTIERDISTDRDVLAARKDGVAEETVIHVLYVRGDGSRAVERRFSGRVRTDEDGVFVEPRCLTQPGFTTGWPATIAVDGQSDIPASIERSEEIVHALDELHDITIDEESGA